MARVTIVGNKIKYTKKNNRDSIVTSVEGVG
jgi:hypothetical protein